MCTLYKYVRNLLKIYILYNIKAVRKSNKCLKFFKFDGK